MGQKVKCSTCGKEVGMFERYQIADKEWICSACFKECGFKITTKTEKMTVAGINKILDDKRAYADELAAFTVTKAVTPFIEFDDNQKKWLVPDGFAGKKKHPKIHNYSDIVSYELLEDGESIIKSGGLGRAAVGGLLLGGAGAIVGGVTGGRRSSSVCTSLRVKITLNDINDPVAYVDFLTGSTKKSSSIYKSFHESAQECLSVLQLICDQQIPPAPQTSTALSGADEILKYKKLLDGGAITQEEYNAKKTQLLGL